MSDRIFFNLYTTPPHECNYLSNQLATTVFIEPGVQKNTLIYDKLSQRGFRRSGEHIYCPQCKKCNACIAVRIPVESFNQRRSQRRVWRKNQDLTISIAAPIFKQEHFNLYHRYITARHQEGGMDDLTPKSYINFLTASWVRTIFYEFRFQKQLIGVGVVDHLKNGLSAVYTFFDPDYSERSLGVYAVLWEIAEAKRLKHKWLYLGYWIKDNQKMGYKINYQPLEGYYQETWRNLTESTME